MTEPHLDGDCLHPLGDGRFEVRGDLTFESATRVLEQSKVLFAEYTRNHIDLAGVREADSAGLALLIEWLSWAQRTEREIDYEGLPEQLSAVAEISEVSELVGARVGD